MAVKKKATFDIAAFINGVERPTKDLTLCFDAATRRRIDELSRELLAPDEYETLAGDPRRNAAREELKAISDHTSMWTVVTVKAPTTRSRTALQIALNNVSDADMTPVDRIQDVYAALFVDCIVAVDGNTVHLTVDQAHQMLDAWPDELAREIIAAIDDMGTSVASIPLSQRLSATLTTPEPDES